MSFDGLPEFKHSFDLDVVGKTTKKTFKGSFTYAKPTIAGLGNIARYHAKLNGTEGNIDDNTDFLHEMISQLRFTIIEAPGWWKECSYGESLYDINVIVAMYNECMDFETKFNKDLDKDANIKKEDPKANV